MANVSIIFYFENIFYQLVKCILPLATRN